MNQIKILSLRFITICKQDCKIHQHMGNSLRGALGTALKTLYNSKFLETDVYDYIFKNQTEKVFANDFAYGKINPFIIDCEYRNNLLIKVHEKLIFNITLIGTACNFGEDIIKTVDFMMLCNIANNLNSFELLSIEDSFTNKIYYKNNSYINKIEPFILSDSYNAFKDVNKIRINFLSPVIIKSKGKYLNRLEFQDFFQAIIRRLILVFAGYADNDFSVTIKDFDDELDKIIITYNTLKLFNFYNYSRTMDDHYQRKGLLGSIEYEGDLNKFLPYINMCSILHIGKGNTIGMGKYSFEVV